MSGPRRRKAPAPRSNTRRRPATGRDFWGTDDAEEDVAAAIRPSDDPAAMIKSLGPPPIPGYETIAEHYFDAVYDKAAALAVALAAANGLLDLADGDEPALL
jgi:hypothetical protein